MMKMAAVAAAFAVTMLPHSDAINTSSDVVISEKIGHEIFRTEGVDLGSQQALSAFIQLEKTPDPKQLGDDANDYWIDLSASSKKKKI